MNIYEATLDETLLNQLISMSADWEAEGSTYGYRQNDRRDIEGNRFFLAEQDGMVLGYLMGQEQKAERMNSVMPDGTTFFEVEELYVVPNHRSEGIGGALFCFAEQRVKEDGISFIMLSTATKNYQRILHFYIEELGMDFWSARLYKRL